MKYTIEGNKNYAAECIVAPDELTQFESLQNLRGISWAGYTILVPNDYAGRTLVVFPAESQIAQHVACDLNLYATQELNADTSEKGYLGKNRRVKAIRMRGVPSNALALPADYFGNPPVGTVFDTVDGVEICRKYEVPVKPQQSNNGANTQKLFRRVDKKFLPEHYETGQYWRESDKFNDDDSVVVTQKIHGTSVRIGRVPVRRKLTWLERLIARLGVSVAEFEYDIVGGSRKVIKDPQNAAQDHYYGTDLWTHAALKYGSLLPNNTILYGELIGYVPGTSTPIQGGYTYDLPQGEYDLYVYRVAVVTEDGGLFDLAWDGVREFCESRGLKHVPELWRGRKADIVPEDWADRRFHDEYAVSGRVKYRDRPVILSSDSPVDEGVVVRREGVIPFALKIKGERFYEFETAKLTEAEKDAG